MAVVGLVLAIISVLCSTIIIVAFIDYAEYVFFSSVAFVGLGLPLSWAAVRRTRESAASSSAIPAAGMAINVVALVIILIWSVLIAIELNSIMGWF